MRLITIFVAFSLLAEIAAGQTTRPDAEAPARWERQVSSLAAAVVAHDQSTIQSLVGADCRIGKFNAVPDADGSQFLDALSSQTVLADHAYVYPPTEMVSDIARDVNSSTIVPDFTKRTLNLDDKRGKTTAMQWISQALNATDGELVGIIILWDSRPDTDDQHRLNFVLIKGQSDGDGFKFTRIVYGDPLQ